MGKTESLFAGVLIAAVVVAIALVVFRGDGIGQDAPPRHPIGGGAEQILSGFSGEDRDDLCTCYEQAYGYAMTGLGNQSLEYKGGFTECSRRLGIEGRRAWTDGWANGERAPSSPRSCRSWLASAGR